jgi:Tfp pilus assembly protein PilV
MTCWSHQGRRRGMTLIEIALAVGMLTIVIGALAQVLIHVGSGQAEARNRQRALWMAHNIAENVMHHSGDWHQQCSDYDATPGVDVVVQDGAGPGSGWSKITVQVRVPPEDPTANKAVTLVFGRAH